MFGVQNTEDNVFKVGDTVYITNSLLSTEECYSAQVCSVITNEETHGLGVHYSLYVATHIEDYMQIREATRCFRSPEQYESLRGISRKARQEMRRKFRDAKGIDGVVALHNSPVDGV